MTALDPVATRAAADRILALLDDPAVGGDLLCVGVAIAAAIDLQHDGLRGDPDPNTGRRPWTTYARIADATGTPRMRGGRLHDFRVRDALRDDRRRYEAPHPGWSAGCGAPMIRRAGYCGNTRGGSHHMLTNWDTGERYAVSYCSRHRDWATTVWRENRAAAPDPDAPRGGAPEPYANTGGHLAAHFPEIDWHKLWARLHPTWTPPRERTTPPRPRLELVVGDDVPADDPPPDGLRLVHTPGPALRLIPSGREIT